jgi:peptide/nickel transport system substrate-binding protein
MVQALKSGDLDYAQGVNGSQFDALKTEPGIATVSGATNGWTMLDLNSYSKDIKGGGASTTALRDPAFRDALGYAIDKNALVQRVLGGHGQPGTTQVPPFQTRWHVEPDHPRTFDIAHAAQKLTDAGYPLDGSGQRLDKDGKAISLRLFMPTDSPYYAPSAAFIKDWFGQLGIKVSTSVLDGAALIEKELPPEAGKGYTADWDMIIWGWTGYADPNPLLQIFTTKAIGSTSDSLYSNKIYDQLFADQNKAADVDARHALMAQMQNIFYDDAPYHILFYEDTLVAYRTDKFAGWTNQPSNGVPLFGYGSLDYTKLTDATAPAPSPSATPAASAGSSSQAPGSSATPVASATPAPGSGSAAADGGGSTPILVLIAVVGVLIGGGIAWRRRGSGPTDDDED